MSEQELMNSEEIDLRHIFKVLNKWKKAIALITLASVLTSLLVSLFLLKPVYESKAMLLVTRVSDKERVVSTSDNLESLISSVSRIPQLTMNTYVNQLKSELLLQKVTDKLALDPKVYNPAALSGITTATALKDSNLIELRVRHNDPIMASRIANTISEQYLELISEKNQAQMTKSVGFLETQREKVEKELDQLLEKMKEFESRPGGVAFLEQQFNTKNQDLSKYQSMLNDSVMELRQAEAGARRLEEEMGKTPQTIQVRTTKEGNTAEFTSGEANPVYVNLSQEYTAKTTKIAEATARINVMESIISQIRQEVDDTQKALVERKAEREKLESQKARLVNARNLLADKVTQTQIASSIDLGDTSMAIISPAMVPSGPIKPNKQLNMAVAFVLGLMMAVFVAFLMEYLDNTIKLPRDVEDKLSVPLLGSIPQVSARRE